MNTEIKTGGSSVPLQPGDLVTSANAPEGAPTWVGLVVQRPAPSLADVHMDGRIFMRVLGDAADNGAFTFYERTRYRLAWADDLDVRPITDAEAVGLAEMLSGGRWEPTSMGFLLRSADARLRAFEDGSWWCLTTRTDDEHDGQTGQIFDRTAGQLDRAKALASRALIARTIEAQA